MIQYSYTIQLYKNVLTSKNTTKIKIANKTYITFFFVQKKYFLKYACNCPFF